MTPSRLSHLVTLSTGLLLTSTALVAPASAAGAAPTAGRTAAAPARPSAADTDHGDRAGKRRVQDVQLLAFNDFHGNLEPPSGSGGRIDGVDAGGAEFLATALRLLAEEVQRPDTITVAAGDLIGASPLLSAAFHEVQFQAEVRRAHPLSLKLTRLGGAGLLDGLVRALRTVV